MILPAILALFAFKFLCSGKSFLCSIRPDMSLIFTHYFFMHYSQFHWLNKGFLGGKRKYDGLLSLLGQSIFFPFVSFWENKNNLNLKELFFFHYKWKSLSGNWKMCVGDVMEAVQRPLWVDWFFCLFGPYNWLGHVLNLIFFFSKHTCKHTFTRTKTRFMSLSTGGTKEKSLLFRNKKLKRGWGWNWLVIELCFLGLCLQVFLFANRSPRILLFHQCTGRQG